MIPQVTKQPTRAKHRRRITVDRYMTPTPHTIGKEQMFPVAHELMRQHKIRHLPVLEGGKLVGLLSDRDLHLVETFKDIDPRRLSVEEAMTFEPYQVRPDASLEETVREMDGHKYGSAVVVDGLSDFTRSYPPVFTEGHH